MDLFQKISSRLIKLIVTARPNLSWHYGKLGSFGYFFKRTSLSGLHENSDSPWVPKMPSHSFMILYNVYTKKLKAKSEEFFDPPLHKIIAP
jgi:hypothetical protein